MNKKQFNKHLTFTIFLLTTLIFIFGILLGEKISDKKTEFLMEEYEALRLNTIGLDIQNLILQDISCDKLDYDSLTYELNEFSERLAFLETSLGWDDKRVMSTKEYFSLMELRHWILMRKNIKECDESKDIILYFYSNKGDCNKCDQQGVILTKLRRENDDLLIYHFDININNPALNTVKRIYGINQTPGLVINEKTRLEFTSLNELQEILNSKDY